MKTFTMYIWKTDARYKNNEMLFSTTVWERADYASMQRETDELYLHHYPRSKYRIEYVEKVVQQSPQPAYYDAEGGSMCNGIGRSYF